MASYAGQSEIAKRYASAFLDLAVEKNALEGIASDIAALESILDQSADFAAFISNPLLRRRAQAEALAAIAEKLEFNELTRKFLGAVAMNRRLRVLPQIVLALKQGLEKIKGEMTAEVISAQTLSAEQVAKIQQELGKALSAKVNVNLTVDPDLIGGVIVKVGSKLIDHSVRTKLERLHRAMKNNTEQKTQKKMKEVA